MEKESIVQTVAGPVSPDQLGIVLMHEHLLIDISGLWRRPYEATQIVLAQMPVSLEILGELRFDPYMNLDNLRMIDVDVAISEAAKFKNRGGQTIVDATSKYNGRDPYALLKIAEQAHLNVIMGCGYYLEYSYPSILKSMSVDDIANEIIEEIVYGVGDSNIKPGIIGEAGVSKNMTEQEIKCLRAQCRAQVKTNLPLTIHLDGWERQGHQILDIVEDEGVNLKKVILCHMNPSGEDFDYQVSLIQRGVYLEYDMIGMDYYYPGDGQSPCDEANARAIKRLIDAGFVENILMSQDVFLKMMLTKYGGFGYSHILRNFLPKLKSYKIKDKDIEMMLICNPKRIFS